MKASKINMTAEDKENFEKGKFEIRISIEIFEIGKPLALITDWSTTGSGFLLMQKMQLHAQ